MSRLLAVIVGVASIVIFGAAGVVDATHTGPGGDQDTSIFRFQHGDGGAHLPASSRNVKLVGKADTLTSVPGGIADVSAFRNHAYLGAFAPECIAAGGNGTGVHVVDISDPTSPKPVAFVPAHPNNYVGEGVHVIHLENQFFRGDILVHNNEACDFSQEYRGGVSLWDVTDPTQPKPLALGVGDPFPDPPRIVNPNALGGVSQSHSAQAWVVGDRAYVVLVDNEEFNDVDILDITNPSAPVLISESGILDWPGAQVGFANGESIYHHDMWVKKIKGQWRLLLSYWDAGWIMLNVNDPANPVFINDTDYPTPDLLGFATGEGNGHQATWSSDNKWILATDEDFSPFRTAFAITTGANAGPYGAGEFGWTVPLRTKFPSTGGAFIGRTVFGGSGCVEDLNGDGFSDRARVPLAADVPAGPGEVKVVVFERGTCFFSIKVESGQLAGYDVVIIGNSHLGSRDGLVPNAFICGGQGHDFTITASAICIGHRAMHLLFGGENDEPGLGALGPDPVTASTTFDGWGYLHLIDANTLQHIDAYAIAEALDPTFATGFGNLTIHEVKTDPRPGKNLAYVSWYAGGLRVMKFGKRGLKEVGHYIAEGGNDFWGTFPHVLGTTPNGRAAQKSDDPPLLLMSDRDSGLWIFRYTGKEDDDDHDRRDGD